jgi:transcription antitermination factor NusA-like protein
VAAPAGDDEDVFIDIVIEGDALGAEMARQEIQAIVDERTSTVNTRLKDIPAEYYPFLSSRIGEWENGRDVKIQIPNYHTWRDQAPPQPAKRGQRVQFAPQPSLPIQLAGDRAAAQEIRQLIENEAKRLSQSHTVEQTSIDRGRHQFIVGDRGFSAQDFLAETGCALIKPPSTDDSDELYIIGPANKIEAGVNKVMELASQMQTAHVDINKPHGNVRGGGLPHTANMARYFKQRQALEELERLHDASIVLPSDGSTSCEVYAKDFKNATKTRQELLGLVAAHPPSRFHPLPVDPFFHQQLKQREASKIRREHGVHIVFPDGHVQAPELLLVYEGPGAPSEYAVPRSSPSDAEKREHQQALQEARKYLESLISQQPKIVSQDLEAQPKYHDKIRKYVDREQKSLGQGQFPVQLLFGPSAAQRGPGAFSMRGPDSQVIDLNAKIQAFLEQEARDEVERGFTTTFDYPQKFANFLIGKRGENINKLREEFDVDIQVQEGKVKLTGPEKKCAACRAHVLSQLKKFEDETTHTIKVKPQYHRDLIGAKGSQVNRLQDRYNVRVNFPRTAPPTEDDATEGGSVRNYRSQAPDEVIIKGPKKGADEAREELLNLLQWTMDNSHAGSVSVHQSQLPQLIGTQGREIEQLRLATGAHIDTPRGEADKDGRVEIKLKGTKKQVDDAKRILLERAKVFDETVTKTIEVERKFHKNLIGPMGKFWCS